MNTSCGSIASMSTVSSMGASVGQSGTPFTPDLLDGVDHETFTAYCCSLLSRHLDLCDDKLQQLLDEGKEHVSKNAATSLRKHSWGSIFSRKNSQSSGAPSSSQKLFGAPLPEPNGPTKILQLIESLKKHVCVDGLFRVSGSKRRTDALKVLLSESGSHPVHLLDLSAVESEYNPHDVASVVKCYFAELPDSILLSKHFLAYEQINDLSDAAKTEVIQLLLLLLPPVNRLTLVSLFQLLGLIVDHQQENRMGSHNLAVVLTPNLCGHSKGCSSCQSAITVSHMTPAVQHMIEHFEEIFQIPSELLIQLRIQSTRKANGQDDEIPVMTSSYCKQVSMDEYEQRTKQTTQMALAALYHKIQDMPDGKSKQHFTKRLNVGMPGTPPFLPHARHRRPLEEYNRDIVPLKWSHVKEAPTSSDIEQMDVSMSLV